MKHSRKPPKGSFVRRKKKAEGRLYKLTTSIGERVIEWCFYVSFCRKESLHSPVYSPGSLWNTFHTMKLQRLNGIQLTRGGWNNSRQRFVYTETISRCVHRVLFCRGGYVCQFKTSHFHAALKLYRHRSDERWCARCHARRQRNGKCHFNWNETGENRKFHRESAIWRCGGGERLIFSRRWRALVCCAICIQRGEN